MTTPEEARTREIEACDSVLSAPWLVRNMIGADGRQLARANRNFWQQEGPETLTRLAAHIDREPRRAESEALETPLPDQLLPGSRWNHVPTNTPYAFGGVANRLGGGAQLVFLFGFLSGAIVYCSLYDFEHEFQAITELE